LTYERVAIGPDNVIDREGIEVEERRRAARQALESQTQATESWPVLESRRESKPIEHAKEMTWARKYGDELARFPGEFVALSATGVAAHNTDLLHLMTTLEELNVEGTYIVSVPATSVLAV
jgi:hypothetical protein